MSKILDPVWRPERQPTDYQIIISYLEARIDESNGRPIDLPSHAVELNITTYALARFKKRVNPSTIARRWREVKSQGMLEAAGLEVVQVYDDPDSGERTWRIGPAEAKEVAA